MEVLLISNDLLGTSGRPIWSKSVCTWLPGSQGWFEDDSLCCKRAIGRRAVPSCFGERAPWCLTQLRGATFHSNAKNQVWGQPRNHGLAREICAIPTELFVEGSPVGFIKEQRASPSASNISDSVTGQSFSVSCCCYTHFCGTSSRWHRNDPFFMFASGISLGATPRKGTMFVFNWFFTVPSK